MSKREISQLQQMQALPLSTKILLTKDRIRQWVNEYEEDGVYISFSGGKDSAVLLHIARSIYPNLLACFIDTGLEYPEVREFVKTFDNVEWLKPKKTFRQVINDYGYPFISKEVSECVFGAKKYLEVLSKSPEADEVVVRSTPPIRIFLQKTYGIGRIFQNS